MESREPKLPLVWREPQFKETNISKKFNNGRQWFTPVVLVLCIAACLSMFVYTLSVSKNVQETTEKLKNEFLQLRRQCASQISPDEVYEDEESDYFNQSPENHQIKKRAVKPPVMLPPFIHLVGKPGHLFTDRDVTYFTWNTSPYNGGIHGFELITDPNRGIYKLKIKKTGVYIVYSQVAIHGRENVNQPHECSHETICKRKGNPNKIVLLSSLATQYQLGAPYQVNSHNHTLRALDTKVHMGVFLLMTDDELSVQVPPFCGNMEYSLTNMQSYFGVAELSHKWNDKEPRKVIKVNNSRNSKGKKDKP